MGEKPLTFSAKRKEKCLARHTHKQTHTFTHFFFLLHFVSVQVKRKEKTISKGIFLFIQAKMMIFGWKCKEVKKETMLRKKLLFIEFGKREVK